MASTASQRDEGETHFQGFFHRSLSPNSFERLRNERSDYFYKPKRGPSMCKNNITITRPIQTYKTVSKLVELLTQGRPSTTTTTTTTVQNDDNDSPVLSKKFYDQKSSSQDSSFLSMDAGDLSSRNSSTFSSRANSSISTVAEQDTQIIIEESPPSTTATAKSIFSSPCHIPAIGLNVTSVHIHLVLLELYPQNVDHSTIVFQRYLISLITEQEHDNWSILNVDLRTINDQQGNFRLFTLTPEQFDVVLLRLETFIRYNSTLSSSFVLNIALTGEQTNDYQTKIGNRLSKINLNFDLIPCRAETYMIGLDFFQENHDECLQTISTNQSPPSNLYPYILVHAEAASTFFYIVHSPSKYSLITTSNLSYKTYENLFRCIQPGYNLCHSTQSTSSLSFDFTRHNLCKHCYRIPTKKPLTSFTRLASRYLPNDYSNSTKSHYIYRGWSNRRTINEITTFDVQTQTDDSYLESSTDEMRSATHRSLLSMINMNFALTIQLICQLYPSISNCVLTGEFFQFERQAASDLTANLQAILGDRCPSVSQLKHESLVSALGCALPRVYFDVLNEHQFLGNDCIS